MLATVDTSLVYRDVSDSYAEWLGVPADAILGRTAREVVAVDAWAAVQPLLLRALAGEVVSYQGSLTHAHGGRRHVRTTYLPHRDSSGAITGVTALIEDISLRREARARLSRSEARYRSLVEASAAVVWNSLPNGAFAEPQPTWEAFTGQAFADYRDFGWRSVVHPDDLPAAQAAWSNALRARGPSHFSYRLRRRDGEWRRMAVHGSPVLGEDGRVAEYIGTCQDIEDWERDREALAESGQRLEDALVAARMVAWTLEPDTGRIVRTANAREVLGIAPDAPMDESSIHPDDREAHSERVARAIRHREGYISRVRWIRPDSGETIIVDVHGRPHEAEDGKTGLTGVVIDVTPQVRAEESASASAGQLERALDAGRMVAWSWDVASDHFVVSQNVRDVFGLNNEAQTAAGVLAGVHPDDRDEHAARIGRALETGGSYTGRFRYVRARDGKVLWMEDHARAGFNALGTPHLWGIVRDVSEEVRAEEKLRLAQQTARMGTWEWDATTGGLHWSPELEDVYGLEPGTFEGTLQAYADRIHPDDRETAFVAAQRLLSEGKGAIEHRIVRPDGDVRWVLVVGSLFTDAEGRAAGATGVAIDITDRKLAEEARLESEQRYRTLVDATASIVWTVNPLGEFVEPQESWGAYTGQAFEQYAGFGWADAVHPDDRARLLEEWSRAVGAGSVYRGQGRMWHAASGAYRHFTVHAAPVRDGSGRVTGWIGTNIDVEAQVAIEAAEREVQARFRALLEALPVHVIITSPTEQVLWTNASFREFTGATDPFSPMDFVHPDDHPPTIEAYERAKETHEGYAIDYRLRRRDGVYRWHRLRLQPIIEDHGLLTAWMGVSMDIEETRQLLDDLQLANQAKDEFLGFVSHELKTPLTTVTGLSEVLVRRGESLGAIESQEAITTLHRDAVRLQGIIENMLTLARMERADMNEPVLIQRLAPGLIERHRQLFPEREVTLAAADDVLPVSAPPSWIEQLIENLVSNAEKYSPPGSPIDVAIAMDGGGVRVSVADRGAGVSPELSQRVFEPFFRANQNELSIPGLGLGLTVCKRMVERLGGEIWLEPREGGGSVAGFRLASLDAGE